MTLHVKIACIPTAVVEAVATVLKDRFKLRSTPGWISGDVPGTCLIDVQICSNRTRDPVALAVGLPALVRALAGPTCKVAVGPKQKRLDWDDRSQPLGKRKVSFVKWLMSAPRRVPLEKAKLTCYYRFYDEIKAIERDEDEYARRKEWEAMNR